MPTDIARVDVQRLQANGGQVVEVLPREEYDKEHLPGAMCLPLEDMRRTTVEAALARDRPVVVYCQDDE